MVHIQREEFPCRTYLIEPIHKELTAVQKKHLKPAEEVLTNNRAQYNE